MNVPGTNQNWYQSRAAAGYEWGFLACSGATTSDVRLSQIPGTGKKGISNPLRLSRSTDLVTITVGGNDVGFSDVLEFCALGRPACYDDAYGGKASLEDWVDSKVVALRSRLELTYRAIRAKAPNARILVLGYPQLFPRTVAEQSCAALLQTTIPLGGQEFSFLYSHAEQDFLRGATTTLNETVEDAVASSGVAEFVPVDGFFTGHEACGSAGEWINPVSLTPISQFPYVAADRRSFHPNPVGQIFYGFTINWYLGQVPVAPRTAPRA